MKEKVFYVVNETETERQVRFLNRSLVFSRLNRSFLSSNSSSSINAASGFRFSFSANLNFRQFRAMLDSVLPLPQHLHPTILNVESNLVR